MVIALTVLVCNRERGGLSICFTGDLLLDRGVRTFIGRNGVDALFQPISGSIKAADFAIANLECPATAVATPTTKQYVFRAEPQWLDAVRKYGFTHLNVANNHAIDHSRRALVETGKNIRKYGLIATGYGATHTEACEPVEIEERGIRIAVFSSVLLPLENWLYLPEAPSVCQATSGQLSDAIREYRKSHENVFIAVMLHWGAEYHAFPATYQRKQASEIITAGADIIIGHHPHVLQSVSFIDGKPVLYSLGNFVFDAKRPDASIGIVATVHIEEGREPCCYLKPYRIENCVPIPMKPEESDECKKYLISLSEGISLENSICGWRLSATSFK